MEPKVVWVLELEEREEPVDFSEFVEFLRLCSAEAFSGWFLLPRGISLFRSLEEDYR